AIGAIERLRGGHGWQANHRESQYQSECPAVPQHSRTRRNRRASDADVRGDAGIIEAPAWTRMTRTDDLLGDLLRQVSRSFYLSLAILPRPLREPIGLAYLLARAADTVADTRLIARAARI